MNWYEYEHLESDEIRLLELYGGDDTQPLQGSLRKFRLPEDEELPSNKEVLLTRAGGVTVPNAPAFQALSYTWGPLLPDPNRLKVFAAQGFRDLAIQPNLCGALRRLRYDIAPGQSSMYWIDALCINQKSIPEKNLQIQKMAMIYNRAERVIVWLGTEDKDSAMAMEFIHRVNDLSHFDPLTQDKSASASWAALMNLMQRDWFSRRWIVQELALARDAWLYCGKQCVSWRSFACVVALFASRPQELRRLFQRSETYEHHPNYIGEVDALGAKVLVDITNNLFRKSRDGKVLERLCSLEALMCILTSFETQLPHDAIYSVLWLAYDAEPTSRETSALFHDNVVRTPLGSPQLDATTMLEDDMSYEYFGPRRAAKRRRTLSFGPLDGDNFESSGGEASASRGHTPSEPLSPRHVDAPRPRALIRVQTGRSAGDKSLRLAESLFESHPGTIWVDYSKPFYEVCTQFMEFAIARSKSLDILCHPWAPEPPPGEGVLPSWIAPVANAPFDKEPGRNAYGRVRADPLVGIPGSGMRNYNACGKTKALDRPIITDRTLTAKGFVLDAIGEVRDTAHEGIIPHSWLSIVDWRGPPQEVPDVLCRALVADRGPGGRYHQPPYFWLACKWVFEQKKPRGGINTTGLMTSGRCPSTVVEFLRRVQAVIWGRKLILSEGRKGSERLLGLVPEDALPGDLLCILHGCSVPVVIRKNRRISAGSSSDNDTKAATVAINSASDVTESRRMGVNLQVPCERSNDIDSRNALSVPLQRPDTQFGSLHVRRKLEPIDPIPRPSFPLKQTTLDEPECTYRFIGEAYIQNYMAGEAFKHQEEHQNPNQRFRLV